MLPKNGVLLLQDKFITEDLSEHFKEFEDAGIDVLNLKGKKL